jgi:hypothetical protein
MVYFTLKLSSNESTFEYSFSQEFLNKKYKIGLLKLDGNLEVNNKFYYLVNGVDKNTNPVNEENTVDIPNDKYEN